MNINKDAWRYWYPCREETVDEDMPKLEKIFRENDVSRILDLGCGTGRHTIYFAERGFDIYGFDFSSYAIQRTREKLRERNLSAHLTVWDMSKKFPYKNEFFDAVIATRVIHHARMRDIKHVLSEVSRVTKEGGYFYVQLPILERKLKYEKVKVIEPGTHIPLEGPERGIPHHDFTKKEIFELLTSVNFEVKGMHERDKHYNLLTIKRQKS